MYIFIYNFVCYLALVVSRTWRTLKFSFPLFFRFSLNKIKYCLALDFVYKLFVVYFIILS